MDTGNSNILFLFVSPFPLADKNTIGLQRRATERMGGMGRPRRGTGPDSERPHLEHAASFSGMDASRRAGPGPSSLGPAGSEPRASLLSRRNTDTRRPAPLNLDGTSNNRAGGSSSAAPNAPSQQFSKKQPSDLRNEYQDEMDDLDQHMYAISIESQEYTVGDRGLPSQQQPSSATSSTSDLRISPIPTRSNSGNSQRAHMLRQPSHQSNNSIDTSELRRMGSNHSHYDKNGLHREDSVRSNTSGGSAGGGMYQQGNGPSYLDEPVYAGLRDKVNYTNHAFFLVGILYFLLGSIF